MTLFSLSSQRKALKLFDNHSNKKEEGLVWDTLHLSRGWVPGSLNENINQFLVLVIYQLPAWDCWTSYCQAEEKKNVFAFYGFGIEGDSWSNRLFKNKLMILTSLAAVLQKRGKGTKSKQVVTGIGQGWDQRSYSAPVIQYDHSTW